MFGPPGVQKQENQRNLRKTTSNMMCLIRFFYFLAPRGAPRGGGKKRDHRLNRKSQENLRKNMLFQIFRIFPGKFPGNFPGNSRKCPGNVREISRNCPGNFLDISRKYPGNIPEISRIFSRNCPGIFSDISRKFPGIVPEISRTFPRNVPEISRIFHGKNPGNFPEMSGIFSGKFQISMSCPCFFLIFVPDVPHTSQKYPDPGRNAYMSYPCCGDVTDVLTFVCDFPTSIDDGPILLCEFYAHSTR